MYLRLTTFTKTLPPMSVDLIFLLFLFRSGGLLTALLTAGALTELPDPQLPATASNVSDWYKAGWCRPDAPLQTKILATPMSKIVYLLTFPYPKTRKKA